ncbi:MAG: 3'(2'),5'-bisphosphate nucleotidase CysQ [Porticoccaceae bacterium]
MSVDLVLLDKVIELAELAAAAILKVYDGDDFEVTTKGDESPVTAADLAAHAILVLGLQSLLAGVPVLSEESAVPAFAERSRWARYWLVDPLDGTKEFVKRNGEFTVNIALVENHVPILGIVHVPVRGVTYAGLRDVGAMRIQAGERQAIRTRTMASRDAEGLPVAVVASRSHGADAVADLLARVSDRLGRVETCNMGSSLKLCLVAEGRADLYPRLAPTAEWDTAAAQAVVEAAGGVVVDHRLVPLRYNTKADLLNPNFYVIGDWSFPWSEFLLDQAAV